MNLLIAVFLGTLFGFVLQKIGAANPKVVIDMLLLRNFHLMKSILAAIAISSLLLYLLMPLGVIDPTHLKIKSAFTGVLIGGGILGVGWAIAGYCPGTALVASGTGRVDALIFIMGGLLGAIANNLVFNAYSNSWLYSEIGGRLKIVDIGHNTKSFVSDDYYQLAIAGFISAFLIIVAYTLPGRRTEKSNDSP